MPRGRPTLGSGIVLTAEGKEALLTFLGRIRAAAVRGEASSPARWDKDWPATAGQRLYYQHCAAWTDWIISEARRLRVVERNQEEVAR